MINSMLVHIRSQVIAAYLADKYRDEGASFDLPTPELRAADMLVQRIHDQYVAPIQVSHPAILLGCQLPGVIQSLIRAKKVL